MIEPIEPTEDYVPDFVVSDIETYAGSHPKNGEVICIDTCWRNEHGTLTHRKFENWGDYWEWLVHISVEGKRFRQIYAHNGGGFDWLSLVEFLIKQDRSKRMIINANCAGSKMITLTVIIRKQLSITFCDSLQLLRSKLDKLAEKFLGTNKVNLNGKLPHEIYESNPKLFYKYLNTDTESLVCIMEKAIELLRDKVCKIDGFAATIGGTAMKVFRTMGINREVSIPQDQKLKDFLRAGYRGGRVECFQPGIYKKVFIYDINSLYPSVMARIKVPISDRGVWTNRYLTGKVGVFEVQFKQKRRDIPPVLMMKGEGVYEGTGTYFTPELDLLKTVDIYSIIKCKMGFQFFDTDVLFGSFVDKLYSIRKQSKGTATDELCKYILNSLYGKFGQHPEREFITLDETVDLRNELINNTNIRCIEPNRGIFGITRDSRCGFEHVGIAGMVTSAARVELYKGMINAGLKNLLYSDTDSIHTLEPFESDIVGNDLGLYKLESEGEAVYVGKKLYALRSVEGKEKVRAKGVSIGGAFGGKLSFDDLCLVCNGEKKTINFHQFPTPMEIFTGRKKSCVLVPRKRTVRRIIK